MMGGMQVRIRHIDEVEPVDFDEVHYDELPGLIEFIKRSGGVYTSGKHEPFHSYQLVLDGEAYAEIVVGAEESAKP